MLNFKIGNLLDSKAEALVNTVNTLGVMGKGIALQFKNQFPENYKIYSKACKNGEVEVGKLLVVEEDTLLHGRKIIINFPTKTDWRKPSEYSYVEKGLIELVNVINQKKIKSIAIPPLGSGNGGLEWSKVKRMMQYYLRDLSTEITIYEPNNAIEDVLNKERAKLTPARAMLLYVLYDLVANGEFVSEFSAEKIAYFLQRFGAKEVFKLNFSANFYGPYSGKVRHVLYHLNGSYISGYSSKDKKPFEEIGLKGNTEKDILDFLALPENKEFKIIADKTITFLRGFYSSFGLELLSTIDFIMERENTHSPEIIYKHIENWSDRKKVLFQNPRFINIAIQTLERQTF